MWASSEGGEEVVHASFGGLQPNVNQNGSTQP